jgi:E3 ubiquitin-protein ligase RNF213
VELAFEYLTNQIKNILFESLYDALNQFYYRFGDNDKFVDLGLGTQRVKCLVHDNFRLKVVGDKKNVYNSNKFPIPLVNRFEKHCLSMELVLDDKKLEIAHTKNEKYKYG